MKLDKTFMDNIYQLKRVVCENPKVFLRQMGYREAQGLTIDDVYFGCGGVTFEMVNPFGTHIVNQISIDSFNTCVDYIDGKREETKKESYEETPDNNPTISVMV